MAENWKEPDYTLNEVAERIPCDPRWLRHRIKNMPRSVPAHTYDPVSRVYRFPHDTTREWFAVRERLRAKLRKPWLRFHDTREGPPGPSRGDGRGGADSRGQSVF